MYSADSTLPRSLLAASKRAAALGGVSARTGVRLYPSCHRRRQRNHAAPSPSHPSRSVRCLAVASDEVIERAGRLLGDAIRSPGRVILFGSHARDEADAESDLDLLVIQPEMDSRRAERVRLRATLRGLGAPVDLIVVSDRHVKTWGAVEGTMLEAALREGRVLAES